MGREKPAYRDNLELVLEFMKKKYGKDKMMMVNADVQQFTGMDYRTVKKMYMHDEKFISVATFARLIS